MSVSARQFNARAVSSAGEHRPYKPGVGRSIRPPPTRFPIRRRRARSSRIAAAGLAVVVLAGRVRGGGGPFNQDVAGNGFPGRAIELGGEFVGPLPDEPATASIPGQEVYWPQDKILGLATELGIGTFKTYNAGDYINYQNGVATPYSSATRIPPDPSASNAGIALGMLNNMAKQVPIDAPWMAASAADWDGQTFESWMRSNLAPPDRPDAATNHLVTLAVEAVL